MPFFLANAWRALPVIAALALSAPAHADVKDGVDAWEAGDFAKAVAEWRPLALAEDPDAQFNLAQAYKLGRGVPVDLAQAEAWYRRAAKQGHLQAEDNLGLVLFTAGRRTEAMPYIVRSAARGEPRAQYVLGTAMFNGDLAAKDWPRAYALTKRASDAGLAIASARLAQLDQLIPLEQRQIGLSLLPQMEKDEARERLAAASVGAPPPQKAPASTIKTASLPPSSAGTSYAPPPVVAPAPKQPVKPAATAATAAATEATTSAKIAQVAAGKAPAAAAAVAKPPVPAAPRAAAPKAPGPWRAQLGAFSVEANARNLWAALARKHAAVAAKKPLYAKVGGFTRLQAGGFASRGEADNFCAAVRKSGQDCLVMDK